MTKPKLLMSACFLGAQVKYNGQSNLLTGIERLKKLAHIISVCPEVCGGLSIPREPAEIIDDQVITESGINVTEQFKLGAQHALNLCLKHQINFALLKQNSPSCGNKWVYDGKFHHQKIAGQGLTAKLLTDNGITVFSELEINDLLHKLSKLT